MESSWHAEGATQWHGLSTRLVSGKKMVPELQKSLVVPEILQGRPRANNGLHNRIWKKQIARPRRRSRVGTGNPNLGFGDLVAASADTTNYPVLVGRDLAWVRLGQ